MRLIRFMSADELIGYMRGQKIVSDTDWHGAGYRSTSEGICFFPADPPPESRLHYVSGVVDFDRIAEFETVGPTDLIKEAQGQYRDPNHLHDFPPVRVSVTEYCMPWYDMHTLKLIRFGTVYWNSDIRYWSICWRGKGD